MNWAEELVKQLLPPVHHVTFFQAKESSGHSQSNSTQSTTSSSTSRSSGGGVGGGASSGSSQTSGTNQPVEFNHAISYVNKIKVRLLTVL